MRLRTVLALAFTVALTACDRTHGPNEFDPARGVIFPATKASSLTFHCGKHRLISDGSWTPSSRDVERLEAKLAPLLAWKLPTTSPTGEARTVTAYYRQYGGLTVGGMPVIFINGFRENRVELSLDRNEWRIDAIDACGGGQQWYFTAVYDPQTDAVSDFAFSQ